MTGVATPDANGNYPEFDAAYWLHQAPAVRKLELTQTPDITQRRLLAVVLTEQGYLIDAVIMVWGWEPGKTMAARAQYGYKTVPAVGDPNVIVAPGVTQPGAGTGWGNDGEILVSLNYDDYPPYVAPPTSIV
jgi:hypothetical protein